MASLARFAFKIEIQVPQPKNCPIELKISELSYFIAKNVWLQMGKDNKKIDCHSTLSNIKVNSFIHNPELPKAFTFCILLNSLSIFVKSKKSHIKVEEQNCQTLIKKFTEETSEL